MTEGVTLRPAAMAETFWVMRDRLRVLGALPGTPQVLMEVEVPPGAGTPLHRHASPELFRVLAGEVTFLRREGAVRGGPGDVVTVPPGVAHGYANEGAAPATLLVVLDRGMEAFFREVGAPAPAEGPPTPEQMARLGAACARHGISFEPAVSP